MGTNYFDRSAVIVSAALAATTIAGCDATGPNAFVDTTVASVVVSPASPVITTGDSVRLGAVAMDVQGHTVSGASIAWSSSVPQVASVTSGGLVRAGAPGGALISASSGGMTGTSLVTVTGSAPTVASVDVSPASPVIATGDTLRLGAVALDGQGNPVTGASIAWSSSDPLVASVTNTGLVRGAAPGSVVISASSGGRTGTAQVTVTGSTAAVASVVVTPGADTLNAIGKTVQLSAQLLDGNGSPVTGHSVRWTSLNNSIAGVDSLGKVTAKALGVAVIAASAVCCNAADSVSIAVRQIVAAVVVAPGTPAVTVGSTIQLTATPQDSSGNPVAGAGVSWTTSNSGVATVNSSGVVQGVSAGTAQITATSQNESGSVNLTVNPATTPTVIGVVISPSGVTIPPNTQAQFGASVELSNGTFTNTLPVTYSATGGTITPSGLYSAGSTTGTFRVIVSENTTGKADTAVVGIAASTGGFPAEYSLTRPLLANKPNALLVGEDWRWATTTADLNGHGFYINKNAPNASGQHADASTVSVVNGPAGARRAEIVADPTFGSTPRLWQTDRSDNDEHTVYYGRSFQPTTKAWYRILVKYMPGFTNAGPGTAANSWKMIFGGYVRHVEWTNNTKASNFDGANQGLGSGSGQMLPNSPQPGQAWYEINDEWTNEEWYELIFYEERLGDYVLRHRRWARRLTFNNVINPNAPWTSKVGWLLTTTSVLPAGADGLQMGINRNKTLYPGDVQWFKWGPWEVIDGRIIPDPYGLANDML